MLLGFSLLLTGCGEKSSRETPINSRFFSSVQVIGMRGAGTGEFNKPRSVALDTNDNLYVVDMTGRVQKFSPDGAFLLSWQMPQTDKGKPKGMCRDTAGMIVVLEPHYSRVNHFSPDGKMVEQWGEHGTNAGQLAFPRAVAVNSRGETFVSEYGLVERVQGFTLDGRKLHVIFGNAGSGPGEFNRAESLGIDSADRIYVADSCNHRIQIFSPDGTWLRSYGKAGGSKGELSYPYDVRVDASGFQFVCEFGNSRIQIFDPNDQPVEILGGAGAEAGQFNNPWSIALDSRGNVYVADSGNHRVQKFLRKLSVVSRPPSAVVHRQTSWIEVLLRRTGQSSVVEAGACVHDVENIAVSTFSPALQLRQIPSVRGATPSPLNGERAGVRGGTDHNAKNGAADGLWSDAFAFRASHPSPSLPLPVEGRGKPQRSHRSNFYSLEMSRSQSQGRK